MSENKKINEVINEVTNKINDMLKEVSVYDLEFSEKIEEILLSNSMDKETVEGVINNFKENERIVKSIESHFKKARPIKGSQSFQVQNDDITNTTKAEPEKKVVSIEPENGIYGEDIEKEINYKRSFKQFKYKEVTFSDFKIEKMLSELQEKFGENCEITFEDSVLSITEKLPIDNQVDDFKTNNEIKNILKNTSYFQNKDIEKEFESPKYKIFLNKEVKLDKDVINILSKKFEENNIIINKISYKEDKPFLEVSVKDYNNINLNKKELSNKKELEKNTIIRELLDIKRNSQEIASLFDKNIVKIVPNEKELLNHKNEKELSEFRLKTFSLLNAGKDYKGEDIIDNLSFFVSSYNDIDLDKILNKINMPYYVEEAKKQLHLRGNEAPQDKNKKEITEFINNKKINITYRTEDKVKIIKRIKFLLNKEINDLNNKKSVSGLSTKEQSVFNSHNKSIRDLNEAIQSFYVGRRTQEAASLLMSTLKIQDDEKVIRGNVETNSFSFTNKEVIENTISLNLRNIFKVIKGYNGNFDTRINEVTKQSFNNIYEIVKNHYTVIPNEAEKKELEKLIYNSIYLYLNIDGSEKDYNLKSLQTKILKLSDANIENKNKNENRFEALKNTLNQNKQNNKVDKNFISNLISNSDNYETLILRLIELSSDKEEKERLKSNLLEFREKKADIVNVPNYNPKNLELLNKLNIENLKKTEVFKRIEKLDSQKIEAFEQGNFIKSTNILIFQETVKNMHKILNENLLKEINLLTLGGTDGLKLKINDMVKKSFQSDRARLLHKIESQLLLSNKDFITQNENINTLYSEYSQGGFKVTKGESFLYQQIAVDILDNFEKNFTYISDSAVNIIEKAFDTNSKYCKSSFENLSKEEKNKVYEEAQFKDKINEVISNLKSSKGLEVEDFNKALKLKDGESFEIMLSEKVQKFFSSISEKDNDITKDTIKNIIIKELKLISKNFMSDEELSKEEKQLINLLEAQKNEENILKKEIEKLEKIKQNTPDDLGNSSNLKNKVDELKKLQNRIINTHDLLLKNTNVKEVKELFNTLNKGNLNQDKIRYEDLNSQNEGISDVINKSLNDIVYISSEENNFETFAENLKQTLNVKRAFVTSGELREETEKSLKLIKENFDDKNKLKEIVLNYQKKLLEIKDRNEKELKILENNIDLKENFVNSLTEKTDVMLNKFKISQIINEDNISSVLFSDNEVQKTIQDNLGLNPETVKIIYDGFKNNLFDNQGNNLIQEEMKNKLYFKDLVQEYKKERKESIKQKISSLEEKIAEIKEENRTKIGNLSHIIIINEIKNEKSLLSKMFSSFKSKYNDVNEEELKYKFISFLEGKELLKHNKFIKLEKVNLFKKGEVRKNEAFSNTITKTIENGDYKNLDKNIDQTFKDLESKGINFKDEDKNRIRKKIIDLINNGMVKNNNKITYSIDNNELLKGVNGKESNLLNDFKEVLQKDKNLLNVKNIEFLINNISFIKEMNIRELSNNNYSNMNDFILHLTKNIENSKDREGLKNSNVKNLEEMSVRFKSLKVTQTLKLYQIANSNANYKFNLSKSGNAEVLKDLKDIFENQKTDNITSLLNNQFKENKSEDVEIINRINHIFECTNNKEYQEYKSSNKAVNKELFIENMISYINSEDLNYKENFLKNLQKMDGGSKKQLSSIFNDISSVDSIISSLSTDKNKLKSLLDNYIVENSILNNLSNGDNIIDFIPSILRKTFSDKKVKVDLTISKNNNEKNLEKDRKYIESYIHSYIEEILSKKYNMSQKEISNFQLNTKQKKDLVDFIYSNNNDFSLFKNLVLVNKEDGAKKLLTLKTQDMMDDFVNNGMNKSFESSGNSINKRNNLREISIETQKLQEKYEITPKFKLNELFNEEGEFDFDNKNNFILLKKLLNLEESGLSNSKVKISGQEISKIQSFEELDKIINLKSGLTEEDEEERLKTDGIAINLLKNKFSSVLSDKVKKESFEDILKNLNAKNYVEDYMINILLENQKQKDNDFNISINENSEISFVNKEGIPILDGIVDNEELVNNDLINVTKAVLYNSKSVENFVTDKVSKNIEQLDTALDETKNIFTVDKKYNTKEFHTFDKISSQKDKLKRQIENLENLEKTMFEEEKIKLFLYNEKDGTKEVDENGEHKYVEYSIASLFSQEGNDILDKMSQYSSLKGSESIDSIVEELMEQEGYTFEKGTSEYNKQYMRLYESELNKLDFKNLFKKRKMFPEEVFENQLKIKMEINGQQKEIDLGDALRGYKKKYEGINSAITDSKRKLELFTKIEEQYQNPKEELKKSFSELKPHWGESQPKKNMLKRLLIEMKDFLPEDIKENMLEDFENSFTREKEKEFLNKYGKILNVGSTSPTYDDLFNSIIDQKLELFKIDKDGNVINNRMDKLGGLMKEFERDTKNNKRISEMQEKIKEGVKKGKDYTWSQAKDFGGNVFADAGRALLMGF